jgi:pimeloyl-ACP methyl ester carboxylesterase
MSIPTGHPEPARPSSSQARDRTVSGPPAPGQGAPGSELQGPDGLAFYAPPVPLPPAAAGQVVWARPLTGAAALPGAAENLLILYHSRTLAGQDTAVSGTISIPPGQPPDGGWPVLSWAHGTTGVANICAPSRDAPGHPSHIYNQLAGAMLNQWVNRGWAVVQTDYEGLGTPGRHPYLVGASEARGTVDIVVAARQLRPGIGRRWAVMGHSQGGHAALFTASLAPAWDCGLDLIGAVAIAPAGGSHDMITEFRGSRAPTAGLGFAVLALLGAAAAAPDVHLDQLLTRPADRLLAVARTGGIDDLSAPGPHPPLGPAGLFRPGADLGPLLRILAANDPAALRLGVPALVVQGSADPIAAPCRTDRITRSLSARGALLDYHVYPGKGHFDVIAAAHTQNAQWIDARLASYRQQDWRHGP